MKQDRDYDGVDQQRSRPEGERPADQDQQYADVHRVS
jgi:hypothetical protein